MRPAGCAANRVGVGGAGFGSPTDEVRNSTTAPTLNRFLKFTVGTFDPDSNHVFRCVTRAFRRGRNRNFKAIGRRIGCADERRDTCEQRHNEKRLQLTRVHVDAE